MSISLPCAIKSCTSFVQVDNPSGVPLEATDFVVCINCETTILIDNFIVMERIGIINPGSAKLFAEAVNRYNYRRNKVTIPHRPVNIGFVRPLVRPLGERQ